MLRVTSSKLAQRTPGDLSVPHSNQDVLQPYTTMKNFVGREWQKRKRDKAQRARGNNFNFDALESTRNPANGVCPTCGDNMGLYAGKPFCPTRECNMSRPRWRS